MTLAIKKKAENDDVSLYGLAREYLDYYNGDTKAAIDALRSDVKNDPKLRQSIIDQAIDEAVRSFVGSANRNIRANIGASKPKLDFKGHAYRKWYDFPLLDGLRLGGARKEDIILQADQYQVLSDDTGHKSRWLKKIAAALKSPNKTVEEQLTETQIEALHGETR